MYIACVYLPPSNSNYFKHYDVDLFFDIENQIQYYSSLGKIILTGDFNARTSNLPDYIESDQLHGGLTRFLSAVFDYCSDESLESRKTSDLNTNDYGYKLLSLCRSSGLRILNGRVGDSSEFTFAGGRGLSVIDYLILAPDAFRLISDFRIDDFNVYSDHAPLLISLICRSHQQNDHDHVNAGNFENIRCLKWDADSANLARTAISDKLNAMYPLIENLQQERRLSQSSPIDDSVDSFSAILTDTLAPYFEIARPAPNRTQGSRSYSTRKHDQLDKPWFTDELRSKHKTYLSTLYAFNRNKNVTTHEALRLAKKTYKSLEYKLKRNFQRHEGNMLDMCRKTNPIVFYKRFAKKNVKCKSQSLPEFFKHFKNLASAPDCDDDMLNFDPDFIANSSSAVFDELDMYISESEVVDCIKNLKT
ncbi:hypothetical protein FSP39_001376 [Pinctada imbricata]|uniref:Endonuclease/exonuclease/phosphatase domain-containing protein n=1 Tax=Pinctada imbricata TaxID=66713 RepID=A0AA88XXV4_PINIB|nr:hypothetical protein FSP39_001376 [Pinctada imbricata]